MASLSVLRDRQTVKPRDWRGDQVDDQIDYGALVLADRVSSRVYTDQRIFEDELERLWGRVWLYVGHESEVSVPGDYVTRTLAGKPVIVARSAEGDVHVLFNRCRHRGNSVCQAASGNASYFRCAYHGWTYANSGALVGVTNPAGYGRDFRKEELGLVPVPRVDSYRGFIFASLSAEVPSLAEQLGRAAETLDAYGDLSPEGEIEVRSGVQRHRYYGNWKLATENVMDGYHLNYVHKTVVGDRVPPDDPNIGAFQDLGSGNAWGFFRGAPKSAGGEGSAAKRGASGMISVFPEEVGDAYYAALAKRVGPERAAALVATGGDAPTTMIFPNLQLITNEIRVVEPVSLTETVVSIYATTAKGAPAEVNSWRIRTQERAHGPAGFVAGDDMEIFERNQRGFAATGNFWANLTRGLEREWQEADLTSSCLSDETPIRGFWQRYRELMSQASPLNDPPSAVLVERGAS